MKKISSKKGESIAETLVAMMIVAMSLTILAGAIVTSARVNSKIKNQEQAFIHDSADTTGTGTVNISGNNSGKDISIGIDVNLHKSEGDRYYYYDRVTY